MPFEAFFSHSTRDALLVERIRARAERAGIRLYLATHDQQPGIELSRKVQRAIDRSQVMVVLLSRDNFEAPYVHQEVGYALKGRKLIIPVVERTVDTRAALGMLQGVEYVPVDFDDPEPGIDAVVEQLTRHADQHRRREDLVLAVALAGLVVLALANE